MLDKPGTYQTVTFATVAAGVLLLVAVVALQASGGLVLDSGDLSGIESKSPGIRESDGSAIAGTTSSPKAVSASLGDGTEEPDLLAVLPDPAPADAEAPSPASAFLVVPELVAPQTYVARIRILGWRNESSRTLEIDVESARLAGPIDALSGAEVGEPTSSEKDHSSLLSGQCVLASVSSTFDIDADAPGSTTVRLVLVPSGTGAVLVIDRLES